MSRVRPDTSQHVKRQDHTRIDSPTVPPTRTVSVWKVHVLLFIVVGVLCGGGTVVGKIGLNAKGANPIVFALYRQAIAAPIMAVWSHVTESSTTHPHYNRATVWQHSGTLMLAGVLLLISNVCYTYAIKLGNPVIGAAWQTTAPIFCAFSAVLLGCERLTVLKAAGIAVAFGGATFVVLYGQEDALMAHHSLWWLSHVLFFTNVNAWALYSIATRRLISRGLPPIFVTTATFAIVVALLLVLVLVLPAVPGSGMDGVCRETWVCWTVPATEAWLLAYFVVVFSVLLYSTINWASSHVPPSTNFIYTPIQPATAAALSAAIIASGYDHHALPSARLHMPGLNALGVVPIAVGLALVLWDELGRGEADVRLECGEEVGESKTYGENEPLLMPSDGTSRKEPIN
eukprot:m.66664 g.66664  ORF g.66664 m.66664 type:complete len:401 (+) comp8375_c0_seq2:289-1491(+)